MIRKSCKNCEKLKKWMIDIAEELYGLNATISGRYISGLHKITKEDLIKINSFLGNIIKDLRKMGEEE